MATWKCIFNSSTNRGIDYNRDPVEGEYSVAIDPINCGWFAQHPSRYMWGGKSLQDWPGWEQEEQSKIDEISAELAAISARVALVEAEQEAAGIHNYTPEQVKNYIDAEFAAADTAAKLKTTIQGILKKMAVYIVRAK